MLKQKEEDTRSATTNFGKEEVLKVFDRNTRMIHFIMFSLSRINGTLAYIYICIYIYMIQVSGRGVPPPYHGMVPQPAGHQAASHPAARQLAAAASQPASLSARILVSKEIRFEMGTLGTLGIH